MDQSWSNFICGAIIIEIYHQIFNSIYFLIRSVKMDQNGSNLIKLDFWWNNHSNISSDFQIYLFFDQKGSDLSKTDKNGSDLYKRDQNGSNLIKLDFWWSNHWNILSDFQLYIFFDQIEPDLSKMDQNGSKWIKLDQIGFLMK